MAQVVAAVYTRRISSPLIHTAIVFRSDGDTWPELRYQESQSLVSPIYGSIGGFNTRWRNGMPTGLGQKGIKAWSVLLLKLKLIHTQQSTTHLKHTYFTAALEATDTLTASGLRCTSRASHIIALSSSSNDHKPNRPSSKPNAPQESCRPSQASLYPKIAKWQSTTPSVPFC